MERSPVDFVRWALDVVAGRDLTKLPTGGWAPEILHPDAVFDLGTMDVPDEARWEGRGGFLAGWQRWLEQWDDYRVTGSNLEDQGEGRVLFDVHLQARGRGSRVPITSEQAQVWTVRDGKLLKIEVYRDRDQALEALD